MSKQYKALWVDAKTHKKIKTAAAKKGQTISAYLAGKE